MRFATLVLILPVLASAGLAQATYDAGTAANPAVAPSPVEQGWTELIQQGGTQTVSGISPDPLFPLNAWQLNDGGGGRIEYRKVVSNSSLGQWDAHVTLLPLEGRIRVLVRAGPLASDNAVFMHLELVGQDVVVTNTSPPIVLAGAAGAYHTYSMRSGRDWPHAEVRFDGALVGTLPLSPSGVGNPADMFLSTFDLSAGRWRVHRMWLDSTLDCDVPTTFCTASATSLPGCQGTLTWWGLPSLTTPDWFKLAAGPIPGKTIGICIFGTSGAASAPIGSLGGLICVASPFVRSAPRVSGGTLGACDGYMAFSLQDLADASPVVVPGALLFAQVWARDQANPDGFLLSDGLRFAVCP